MIEIKNISKTYKSKKALDTKALDDISLTFGNTGLTFIVGASGSGKSTLLNILGGMDNPTSGEYIIDGKDVSKFNNKELEDFRRFDIGFVFQFYNLMGNLTTLENVSLAASIAKEPFDSMDILDDVGLTERINNFPSQLSGGEQQRVSIARAVVKNPKMLLCDEPTGALDSKTGVSIIKLLYGICKKTETTVIVVTHNSSLAQIATRLITIQDGTIVKNEKQDPVEDLDKIIW